ncbi:DJ-1/PfpI family protein [Dactylosporangium matsuzakiense]|uniref:Glutamine amidotransferase n=1 Tax=Dactylosporangium matsuzakiense TaxID=53360 RepID=A0A9W6KW67_9ACTN|nr:DJ-1/PfpI family protein [Dactylosporangium matsuzakiense]UWZ42423.1 DJ-1/PfpI family protein [Dactylosporangium matsuzakiense]GLL08798.1 glutamine amidotransferase [Dactylosporangium matsuzakiense]
MLVQIVLFDGFDPLDVVAPFEVLAAGGDLAGGAGPDGGAGRALDVELVAVDGPRDVVSGTRGLTLRATAALRPDRPGYVVVPGASGPSTAEPGDGVVTVPMLLARFAGSPAAPLLRAALDHPEVTVATVCGGSLALAMAGLIAGRPAVTHHLGREALAATGAQVVAARIVDDGDLLSAGGVTSGLDLGLYILERELGPRVAHAVETFFEHERRGVVWRNTGPAPLPV